MNDNDINIKLLKQKCAAGHINWTTHVLERMQERDIEPTDVINCIDNGKIIEQYPNAYPYPACLILGTNKTDVFIHTVVGYGNGLIWIITVYHPDENEWTNGFSTRKE